MKNYLCISLNKVNWYIEKYCKDIKANEIIFEGVKHLISEKRNISDICYYNYMKIRVNFDDDLPLEKILNIYAIIQQNAVIFIGSFSLIIIIITTTICAC